MTDCIVLENTYQRMLISRAAGQPRIINGRAIPVDLSHMESARATLRTRYHMSDSDIEDEIRKLGYT